MKPTTRKKKRTPPEMGTCEDCKAELKANKLYRFSWRYGSRTHFYLNTGRRFIVTGFRIVCKDCLKKLVDVR
jgi:hydrogenase maturation factor HypF (carbamoyltransferase family)